MSTKIILIRHGETAWNRGKIFRGTYDIPLNENGEAQAQLAAQSLASVKIDAAYSSPLSRALKTAEIVSKPQHISPQIHEGLNDMDYGDWTGKEDADVAKQWPEEHAAWTSNPHAVRPPNGTTLKEIFATSFRTMEDLATQHEGQTIAIFSHRVVNKLLILGALSLSLERFPFIIQRNACINEFTRIQNGYLIQTINDVAHIKNSDATLLQADF